MKTEQPIDLADLQTGREQAYYDTITRYIRELAGDQEIDIMTRINLIGEIESLAEEMISKIEQEKK
jgi:hypothetical protein